MGWFLSGGVIAPPLMFLFMLFFRQWGEVLKSHEWWYHCIVISGAFIGVAGMYMLELVRNKRLLTISGSTCWVTLFILVWEFSAHDFRF